MAEIIGRNCSPFLERAWYARGEIHQTLKPRDKLPEIQLVDGPNTLRKKKTARDEDIVATLMGLETKND